MDHLTRRPHLSETQTAGLWLAQPASKDTPRSPMEEDMSNGVTPPTNNKGNDVRSFLQGLEERLSEARRQGLTQVADQPAEATNDKPVGNPSSPVAARELPGGKLRACALEHVMMVSRKSETFLPHQCTPARPVVYVCRLIEAVSVWASRAASPGFA